MTHRSSGVSTNRSAGVNRTFPLTLAAGFLFLALVAWWRGHPRLSAAAGLLAALALFAALFFPTRLGPLERAWMKLGEVIGNVTTPVLLSVVYYIVLTPVGLLRRATASRSTKRESYWNPHSRQTPPSRMERQF